MPAREPRGEPSFSRQLFVLLVIVGIFGAGVFFYIRNARTDAGVADSIEKNLATVGSAIWSTGQSTSLFADTDETQKDLNDLPRVVMAVRASVKSASPSITVAEGDPPLFKGSHQIVYRVNKEIVFVVRVEYQKDMGDFKFLGERNGISASRKDQKLDPANPGQPAPLPENPPVPGDTAVPPPVPAPAPAPSAPAPGEKVSEQP
jgi:hypothetical protein